MKTQTSKRSVWVKSIILIPLATLLLLSFSTTETRYKEVTNNIPEKDKPAIKSLGLPYPLEDTILLDTFIEQGGASEAQLSKYNTLAKKYNARPIATRRIPLADLKILESVYKAMTEKQKQASQPFPECLPQKTKIQDGASRKLMKEYTQLAKKYNNMPRNNMKIQGEDIERLEYIYSLMSEKQKADAEPFPDFPPVPDPPPPPTPEMAVAPNTQVSGEVSPTLPVAPYVAQGEVGVIPAPTSTLAVGNGNTTNSNWVVSTAANRNNQGSSLLPNTPAIAIHANTEDYSKELKASIQKYLEKNRKYEEAVNRYRKEKVGTIENLRAAHQEAMQLYMSYQEIALQENKLIYPSPNYAPRIAGTPSAPPPPPPPKSPIEFVQDMAKKNAEFYYNGKKISAAKAVKILEASEDISLLAKHTNLKRPRVELSDGPIKVVED